MTIPTTKMRLIASCTYLAMLLLASCTSREQQGIVRIPPKILVSGYSQTTEVPLKVELFLSDELRAAEWHEKGMKGFITKVNYQLALGEALASNAENVTREVFIGVVVTGGSEGPGQAGLRAALIPRFVNAEQYGNTLAVLLEWTLQDADGNIVWVDTIKGEGDSSWSLWSGSEPASTPMLNDLFHKSFTALSSSRAIREFAAKQTHLSNSTEPRPRHERSR